MQTSCHPTGAKGRGDVETTRVGIDVQNLAGKVEAGNELAFQSFRIDFLETNATLGDKGFS